LDGFRTRFLLKTAILLTLIQTTAAQNRIDVWTTDNGLPQNSVTGLTQTPDGYIWLTTNDGLVRFDEVQFTVFNRGKYSRDLQQSGLLVDRDAEVAGYL
jgi:ligand-binding sensor domain-containing protein